MVEHEHEQSMSTPSDVNFYGSMVAGTETANLLQSFTVVSDALDLVKDGLFSPFQRLTFVRELLRRLVMMRRFCVMHEIYCLLPQSKKEAKPFLHTGRMKSWGRADRQISKGYIRDLLLL